MLRGPYDCALLFFPNTFLKVYSLSLCLSISSGARVVKKQVFDSQLKHKMEDAMRRFFRIAHAPHFKMTKDLPG